jgi:PAS domain S-box-containing protein
MISDCKGNLKWVNPAFTKMTGYTREEAIGKKVNMLKSGKHGSSFYKNLWQTITSGQVWHGEIINRLKDGSLYTEEMTIAPVRSEEGQITNFIAIKQDVTERKRIEQMRNEFVSIVSHELRTPLTSISGSLELLMGGVTGEVSSKAKSLLDIAHRNSHRLINLVNDILDTEKIESGKMDFYIKPVELMPIIEQAVDVNRSYGEQLGIRFAIENTLPGVRVNADSNRLMQVFANLLSNAAKFSPHNDTVLISVSKKDGIIRVSVTDHGSGIPEEFRSRIFQRFAQADSSDKRQKGGTGLGLSISKAIIERFGGNIGYETEIGKGTTFWFELPELLEEEIKEAAGLPRILICEDDTDVANLIALILKDGGFEIDIAYTAADAKHKLEQNIYTAMTLDLILPDEDGILLIKELRKSEKTRQLPIIVVSVKASEGYKELDGGFAIIDWIDKPIDAERLLSAVKAVCLPKMDRKPYILHIEDDPDICHVVSAVLQNDVDIVCAGTLHDAKQKLGQRSFDMVILDLILPDGDGTEIIPYLKRTPVVIYSVKEAGSEIAGKVSAALVKSRTSGEELLKTIRGLLCR